MALTTDPKMKRGWVTVERLMLTVIVVLFFVPLTLSLLLHFEPSLWSRAEWLRNQTLGGVVAKESPVGFSWRSVAGGEYQEKLAGQFNGNFAARELLIRLTCEGWYRAFRQSPLEAGIILGKEDFLFLEAYLREYCFERPPLENLDSLAGNLRSLQDVCDRMGIAFVFLITPSKASVMPEYIPERWLQRYDPRPRAYDQLLPLLEAHGVHFVDGHALSVEARGGAQSPVFPKGGIHWGSYAAWMSANAVVRGLIAQGKTLKPIAIVGSQETDLPEGADDDLLKLMNLTTPWRYPVTNLKIKSSGPAPAAPYVVMVGASFATEVARQLSASRPSSKLVHYYYYKLEKRCFEGGNMSLAGDHIEGVDFDREIFASDCLILESNEVNLGINGRTYLTAFLKDALDHVARGLPDRRPYLGGRDSFEYVWGQEMSFRSADNTFGRRKGCLRGFAAFEEQATWTEGPSASIELSVPSPQQDLLLAAEVGALIEPPKLIAQEVTVFANDGQIGVWKFDTAGKTRQTAVIPKNAVGADGQLALRFEIARPTTPRSLGRGDDGRELGIWFSSMRIDQVRHRASENHVPPHPAD